jgi:hypothetical protein
VTQFDQYGVINIPPKILQLLSNISDVALEVVSPNLSLVESKVQSFLTSNFPTTKYFQQTFDVEERIEEISYLIPENPRPMSPYKSKYFQECFQRFLTRHNFLCIPQYAIIWKPHDRGIILDSRTSLLQPGENDPKSTQTQRTQHKLPISKSPFTSIMGTIRTPTPPTPSTIFTVHCCSF